MSLATKLVSFVLATSFAIVVAAEPGPRFNHKFFRVDGQYSTTLTGQVIGQATAVVDTIYLLGGLNGDGGDFEDSGVPSWDGWTSVDLTTTSGCAVGDFAKVWFRLIGLDPCHVNTTPVVAFIDDGLVVPGTGGYLGTSWTYGPAGYIVNPEGGLCGPDFYIHNEIWSPVLNWPAGDYDGAVLAFDVYSHMNPPPTGIFYIWHVRSTSSTNPSDIENADWHDRGQLYDGGPKWYRRVEDVSDLLEPGRRFVQIALGINELGWIWGLDSTDGTPAAYFDNVSFCSYEFRGPAIATIEMYLAQDNFPQIGTFDFNDPYANSIRFDMGLNISPSSHLRNDPGDSIIFDIVPIRPNSILNDIPKLYYKLKPNTVFDSVRSFPSQDFVYGNPTYMPDGTLIENRYNFDLPDTGFLFPGDIIHYYIEAQDNSGGDIGTTLLPQDTTGFSFFPGQPGYINMKYPSSYIVHALPSFWNLAAGSQPKILLWYDGDISHGPTTRRGENEWFYALMNLGYQQGFDYDLYYTNEPTAGAGNGLGGRATAFQLAGYETVLYTVGDLNLFTIANGDFAGDAANDVGVLDTWLRQGNLTIPRHMFLTGDNLVYDLTQNGGNQTQAFVSNWIGVNFQNRDVRPFIDNQTTPSIQPIIDNSLNLSVAEWFVYGGCPTLNPFDAVTVFGLSEKVAEFLAPGGGTNQYSYAAMSYYRNELFNADIVYTPYDFLSIWTPGASGQSPIPSATRTQLLNDVLTFFGHLGTSPATPVSEALVFTIKNYPNPFNPSTKIEYAMPVRGELSIKIYNVRGELVKTLIDDVIAAGPGYVTWDGTDKNGAVVASGVYFYESKAFGETKVQKMALLK